MKKFVVLSLLVVALLLPASAVFAAASWPFNFGPNDHWGTPGCSTSYPNINFDVLVGSGYAYFRLEKLSGGSWVPLTGFVYITADGKYHTFTNPASSSGVYRIYAVTTNSSVNGMVYCYGTW